VLIDILPSRGVLVVEADPKEKWRLSSAPSVEYDKKLQVWLMPILPNVAFLRSNFTRKEFTPRAIATIRQAISRADPEAKYPGFKLACTMKHQSDALDLAHDKKAFFFAHAMGTGKTLTVLTLSSFLASSKGMEGLLVLCPATIRTDVWLEQVVEWMPALMEGYENLAYSTMVMDGNYGAVTKWMNKEHDGPTLRILIASIQSMSSTRGRPMEVAKEFLQRFRCGMVVDESSWIKNYQTKRTKNITILSKSAHWKWCGTGTKITQGIHDLYSQFAFLDPAIIGHKSFYTFRNRYCRMGGFENRTIIGYDNVQELLDLIKPYVHVVRKEDANDLPPKTYQIRTVSASKEQKDLYQQLKDYMEAISGDGILTTKTVLERFLRYQQIAGGHLPYMDEFGEWHIKPIDNPKLEELMSILGDTDEKVIIWARFVPEIQDIERTLAKEYGPESVVTYYGETDDRSDSKSKFQNGNARFIVANQQTGSMGLTLTAATLAIYFSNSFSYQDRVQSEDRCHRTGQKHPVTYIDILSDLPIDRYIRHALEKKQDMATFVADNLRAHR